MSTIIQAINKLYRSERADITRWEELSEIAHRAQSLADSLHRQGFLDDDYILDEDPH